MAGRLDYVTPPKAPNTGTEAENRVWEQVERDIKSVPTQALEEKEFDIFADEELVKALEQLLKDVKDEDKDIRNEQMRIWKKLEFYWSNILDILYDDVARDWRVPTDREWEEIAETRPRAINIFRPHCEAIVAALSVTIPNLIFYPDDAESPDDLEAAKAYRNISDLLSRHNDGPMLFIRTIVIMLLQGTVFGYNYYREDTKYGTIDKPEVAFKDFRTKEVFCESCGSPLDGLIEGQPQEIYECPDCNYRGPGAVREQTERLPEIINIKKAPKSSISQEVFSSLNVKIPFSAKRQEEVGYLLLEFQQSTAMLREIFDDRAEDVEEGKDYSEDTTSSLASHYRGNLPQGTAKVSALWLRPWQFWMLGSDETTVANVRKLKKQYPDGCYAIFVNERLFEIAPENLDEHWTISKNPLGNSLISRPLAENLAVVQDLRAELVELEMQTVEHGIPETFADPKVLDFNRYGQERSQPGMVTPAVPRPGKSLADGFFTTKTAILSQEVDPIRQHLDQDGQFVLGSFPSVYGGPAQGGSKTASEYQTSKAMALQRLGTTYKILCEFYADFQARSANEYAKILYEEQRDEVVVKREGSSFINNWIRYQALTGKVGKVEAEATEQLPVSWAQKKDVIFQLIGTGIPEILQLLIHPRNIELVKNATGLQDIYVPGEDARNRQLREFVIMASGGMVPVNPILDNHSVHAEVLRTLLESSAADTLEEGVKEIMIQHLMEHESIMAQNAANQVSAPEEESKVNENA